MARRFGLFAAGWVLVLLGGLLAHLIQTSGGVKIEDVRYKGGVGETISALLYVPATATQAHPAPAVMLSHGFINTREMQSPFAIELARRGFVVLAIDMTGHGYSDGPMGVDGFGGPASLAYLHSLPFVDDANVGLEGHSMGGAPTMYAATAEPDGYRAVVLEGSTTQFFGAGAAGTPTFPRNLEVVFGQFDEFAPLMWGKAKGGDVGSSPKLEAIFGQTGRVVPGETYGDIAAGTARRLVIPPLDHPQEHFSNAGVGVAVDWFQQTLKGEASPRPATDQIWFYKEIGTGLGFIGAVALMLGAFQLVYAAVAGFFSDGEAAEPAVGAERRDRRWIIAAVAAAAIPAITFYPLMKIAPAVFFAPFAALGAAHFGLRVFPAQIVDQLVVWALGGALISFGLSFLLRRERPVFRRQWIAAIGAALVSVGMAYLALIVVDALFKTDFRFWVLGLKPFDARRFGLFLIYLPFFVAYGVLALRGFAAGLAVKGEGLTMACLTGGLAYSAGFIVLLAIQYVCVAATGLLATPDEPLNTIIAFQFVPILAVVGVIAAFTWRLTGDYLPGALIAGLFLSWYVVVGTAIFPPSPNALAPPRGAPPPAAAAPTNAAPVNALPANALPANALPTNAAPTNEAASNATKQG